jgi:hypothetical protein
MAELEEKAAEESVETETKTTPKVDERDAMESKLAHSLICMALGLDTRLKWGESSSTADLEVSFVYAPLEDDSAADGEKVSDIATIRGRTTIPEFTPADFYEFVQGNTGEEYDFIVRNDDMCDGAEVLQRYDKTRALVHSRFNAGSWAAQQVVWNRDFVYMKKSMYFQDYKITHLPDGTELEEAVTIPSIGLGLVYSVEPDHPDALAEIDGHVRGHIHYAGYAFFELEKDSADCDMIYVVRVDPAGSLPTWVINIVGPGQARVCTAWRENIGEVKEILARRRSEQADVAADGVDASADAEEVE